MQSETSPFGNLLTTDEAAELMGVAGDTIYRYIYRGKLSVKKFGSAVAIPRDEVERYLAEKRPYVRKNKGSRKKQKKS